jgi:ferritin-like metal-binding protein YciE
MAKKEKMLKDLFHETLKDIYYAEKKILPALPKIAKAAQSEDLQAAFEKHEGETKDQVERLEQVFELIKQLRRGKICDAINGIIDESQEVMKEFKGSAVLDAGLLASAQAVEHYEISRYGTLKAWVEQLGLQEAVRLLDETLEEEKKTDDALTELGESRGQPRGSTGCGVVKRRAGRGCKLWSSRDLVSSGSRRVALDRLSRCSLAPTT